MWRLSCRVGMTPEVFLSFFLRRAHVLFEPTPFDILGHSCGPFLLLFISRLMLDVIFGDLFGEIDYVGDFSRFGCSSKRQHVYSSATLFPDMAFFEFQIFTGQPNMMHVPLRFVFLGYFCWLFSFSHVAVSFSLLLAVRSLSYPSELRFVMVFSLSQFMRLFNFGGLCYWLICFFYPLFLLRDPCTSPPSRRVNLIQIWTAPSTDAILNI